MVTYHIHISGQVHGVGFRPYVYRLAQKMELKGWVKNTADGVHIEVNGDESTINRFVNLIVKQAPSQSKIENHTLSIVEFQKFINFQIAESSQHGNNSEIRITPDFSICENCNTELLDSDNRRHGYGFTTCTQCGPRYSIQTNTPYDRYLTSMGSFDMCDECLAEYKDPSDNRFYSQTNSCETCGIQLSLFNSEGNRILTEFPIKSIVESLQLGKTVAVKGIGGYILMCDSSNEEAIQLLRKRKNRPTKPLAVLYADLALLKQDVNIEKEEIELLFSAASPIVLIDAKEERASQIQMNLIAPGLNKVGVMIPYAPLLKLIAEGFGKPLIATSGNISGAPIAYQDVEAISQLASFADVIVTHNREIVVPQDDSVAQFVKGRLILLRRSRGYAPSYFGTIPKDAIEGVVAMGSDLKASVAISHHQQWYISQYLGNQESYEAQQAYVKVLSHLMGLTGIKPRSILVDKHPMYHTTQNGKSWAMKGDLPLVSIQHHEAHFAAVLQENDLMKSESPVLGVIWDGTGYGTDGNSWGGEFFEYNEDTINRVCHLGYVPLIVGDKMAKEPRISALAFCFARLEAIGTLLSGKFSEGEFQLYSKMLSKPDIFTSSIGRLFDAVASLLGLCDKSSYEGEAALYLQHLASTDAERDCNSYSYSTENKTIGSDLIMSEIIEDLKEGVPKNRIAFKFHYTLVDMIKAVVKKMDYTKIAFSGGVFQNSLLVELIEEDLREYKLYFHKELSPNDENISFGQLAHYHMQNRKLNQTVAAYEVPYRI